MDLSRSVMKLLRNCKIYAQRGMGEFQNYTMQAKSNTYAQVDGFITQVDGLN